MPNPRVIFVNRVHWPAEAATAQLLADLAEGLAARDWPVHVIAAGEAPGSHHGVTIHRTGPGDRHGGLISRALNYGRFVRQARRELAALARPGDVVVVMTDPPMLGAAMAGTARRAGAGVVQWIQDVYPEIVTAHVGAAAGLPLWPLRARRDAAWRSARRCVTLGETMAQTVASRGVPAGRITIVPNWAPLDLAVMPNATAIAAQRAAWGLADKFIVAYSGNLGRVHEFAAVIEAARRLESHPEIVFLFIGTGARFGEVRAATEAGKLPNIRFLPFAPRTQLAASLAAADAQLVTLRPGFAGLVFPSKLAGVLAAGRPTLFVGPPEGEIAALLKRAGCGAAFAPSDGAGLAATILHWQTDPAWREQVGRNARSIYESHFTFRAALTQWEEILRAAAKPA